MVVVLVSSVLVYFHLAGECELSNKVTELIEVCSIHPFLSPAIITSNPACYLGGRTSEVCFSSPLTGRGVSSNKVTG